MLKSIGKLSGESVESVQKKKREATRWEGFAKNGGFKSGIKEWGVMECK